MNDFSEQDTRDVIGELRVSKSGRIRFVSDERAIQPDDAGEVVTDGVMKAFLAANGNNLGLTRDSWDGYRVSASVHQPTAAVLALNPLR